MDRRHPGRGPARAGRFLTLGSTAWTQIPPASVAARASPAESSNRRVRVRPGWDLSGFLELVSGNAGRSRSMGRFRDREPNGQARGRDSGMPGRRRGLLTPAGTFECDHIEVVAELDGPVDGLQPAFGSR